MAHGVIIATKGRIQPLITEVGGGGGIMKVLKRTKTNCRQLLFFIVGVQFAKNYHGLVGRVIYPLFHCIRPYNVMGKRATNDHYRGVGRIFRRGGF